MNLEPTTIEMPLSYIDIPSVFSSLDSLGVYEPLLYVKYTDQEGFDISLEFASEIGAMAIKDPLMLQYVTVKLPEQQAMIDFDFDRGRTLASYSPRYCDIVLANLAKIDKERDNAIYDFDVPQLKVIYQFEAGRFLMNCVDQEGRIWTDPHKRKLVEDAQSTELVAISLVDLFPESPLVKRIVDNICKYSKLEPDAIYTAGRMEVAKEAIVSYGVADRLITTMDRVMNDEENGLGLLRHRKPEGFWQFFEEANAPITGLACQVLNLKL